jgi:adenine-specific DNA-methyltransferase
MLKHNLGQYFTKNIYLKTCVCNLIKNEPSIILEPSVGRGDLVDHVLLKYPKMKFDLYEIDQELDFLESISVKNIRFGNFLEQEISCKYETIIGNPPYVKTPSGNLYIHFIDKCYELLKNKGELIFIVPSDFIKLTSAKKVINKMMKNGTFTDIIHPNNESLFEGASIDVIVFRYCKDTTLSNKIKVNNEEKFIMNTDGIITFYEKNVDDMNMVSDYFDVYVGMVTGKENIYKNKELGNITLLNKKDQRDKYIFIDEFPTVNEKVNAYMLANKTTLINRKIKKFTEDNWFKWGAPRNQKKIENNVGRDCIYVSTLTRNAEVAFIGKVEYFGGSLIMLLPKPDVDVDIEKVVNFMNSDEFKKNYMYSGRFKIGHRPLCNSYII